MLNPEIKVKDQPRRVPRPKCNDSFKVRTQEGIEMIANPCLPSPTTDTSINIKEERMRKHDIDEYKLGNIYIYIICIINKLDAKHK